MDLLPRCLSAANLSSLCCCKLPPRCSTNGVDGAIFLEPVAGWRQFDKKKFFRDAEALHLSFDEALVYSETEDMDVRKRTNDFVSYGPEFAAALDEITSNVVGRTLFRFIVTKARMRRKGERIRLIPYEGSVNQYSIREFAVKINLRMFDVNGEGVRERQYYYVDKGGMVVPKPKTLAGTMFHEFCHALHDLERASEIAEGNRLAKTNEILYWTWGSDEELRTIAGCTLGPKYDPVCDHCYELCVCVDRGRTFFPRYGHDGYDASNSELEESQKRQKMLAHLSESRIIMNGWRDYVS